MDRIDYHAAHSHHYAFTKEREEAAAHAAERRLKFMDTPIYPVYQWAKSLINKELDLPSDVKATLEH